MQEINDPQNLILDHQMTQPKQYRKPKKQYINSLRQVLEQNIPMNDMKQEIPNVLDLCLALPSQPTLLSKEIVEYYIVSELDENEVSTLFVASLNYQQSLLFKLTQHPIIMKQQNIALKGLDSDKLTIILDEFERQMILATRVINPVTTYLHYQNILDWIDCVICNNYLSICLHENLKTICNRLRELVIGYSEFIDVYQGFKNQQQLKSTIIIPKVDVKGALRVIF